MEPVNVYGARNLLVCCKKNHVKKILLLGSVGVLSTAENVVAEDASFAVNNPYEKSKLKAEEMFKSGAVDVTVIRPTNVAGKLAPGVLSPLKMTGLRAALKYIFFCR